MRKASPFSVLDVNRLKKTIDKSKFLCYNLVTKLRQELNKIKIGCDLPQKGEFLMTMIYRVRGYYFTNLQQAMVMAKR